MTTPRQFHLHLLPLALAALLSLPSLSPASPPKISAFTVDTAASQSTISFAAESGTTYELQRASVLSPTSDWATVDTRRAEDTGTMELTDAIPAERTRSYYRIAEAAAPAHKAVQLWEGGPFWAETNIGAEKPEDAGLYFWWGDTVGYRREGDAWVASDGSAENFSFSSGYTPTYNKNNATLKSEGWIDASGNLAPEHDAAQVHWGGGWRMPTDSEFAALINNTTMTWTTSNGVYGRLVTGKGDYASASIFLPAAGRGYGTGLDYSGSYGSYWSTTPNSSFYYAWYLYLDSGDFSRYNGSFRSSGQSVRALRGFAE